MSLIERGCGYHREILNCSLSLLAGVRVACVGWKATGGGADEEGEVGSGRRRWDRNHGCMKHGAPFPDPLNPEAGG